MSRTFSYAIQGQTLHDDPFKIRRILLEQTDGRCWKYLGDLSKISKELDELIAVESTLRGGELEQCQAKIAISRVAISKLEGVLAKATMEAFDFEELNRETGDGVTELEALLILKQYMEYAEGKDWRSGI